MTTRAGRMSLALAAVLLVLLAAVAMFALRDGWWRDAAPAAVAPAAGTAGTASGAQAAGPIRLQVYERLAPVGTSCPAVLFAGARARQAEVIFDDTGNAATRRDASLCAMDFVVAADPGWHVAGVLVTPEGQFAGGERPPIALDGLRPLPGPVTWTAALPMRQRMSLEYRLLLLGAQHPVGEDAAWLRRQPDLAAAMVEIAARGLTVVERQHRIEP